MNSAIAHAKSDFDAKSATVSDQDNQAYYQQLQQGLQQKQQELLGPINDEVTSAVKTVAEAKGLTEVGMWKAMSASRRQSRDPFGGQEWKQSRTGKRL